MRYSREAGTWQGRLDSAGANLSAFCVLLLIRGDFTVEFPDCFGLPVCLESALEGSHLLCVPLCFCLHTSLSAEARRAFSVPEERIIPLSVIEILLILLIVILLIGTVAVSPLLLLVVALVILLFAVPRLRR